MKVSHALCAFNYDKTRAQAPSLYYRGRGGQGEGQGQGPSAKLALSIGLIIIRSFYSVAAPPLGLWSGAIDSLCSNIAHNHQGHHNLAILEGDTFGNPVHFLDYIIAYLLMSLPFPAREEGGAALFP